MPKNSRTASKVWWQPFALVAAILLLLWVVGPGMPTTSPRQMVMALAAHGEAIPAVSPASSNALSSAACGATWQAPGAVSNKQKPPTSLGKPSAAAATGHYVTILFAQLSSFQFQVTDDLENPSSDLVEANQKIREQIPDHVWQLNERDVALTGYMLPVQLKDGLATDFMLLPNQMSCCYGIKPRINEWVIVRTTGKGAKPVMDTLVTAEGTFHVGAQRENGSLTGIYQLDLDHLITPNK